MLGLERSWFSETSITWLSVPAGGVQSAFRLYVLGVTVNPVGGAACAAPGASSATAAIAGSKTRKPLLIKSITFPRASV